MAFPIKVCIVCKEEFELKPDEPGFASRCPECSTPESMELTAKRCMDADERKTVTEANEARSQAMREPLYRKDSNAGVLQRAEHEERAALPGIRL